MIWASRTCMLSIRRPEPQAGHLAAPGDWWAVTLVTRTIGIQDRLGPGIVERVRRRRDEHDCSRAGQGTAGIVGSRGQRVRRRQPPTGPLPAAATATSTSGT
jgi:hypothetical protein